MHFEKFGNASRQYISVNLQGFVQKEGLDSIRLSMDALKRAPPPPVVVWLVWIGYRVLDDRQNYALRSWVSSPMSPLCDPRR